MENLRRFFIDVFENTEVLKFSLLYVKSLNQSFTLF